MTKNEVMQMAFDALDNVYITSNEAFHASTKEALRAALTQPEQEPQHKLICPTCKADRTKVDCQGNRMNCGLKFEAHTAQSEPAAWMILATTEPTPIDVTLHAEVVEEIANPIVPLYTTPEQRKPLSKEQYLHLDVHPMMTIEQVVRIVEAAHGIKD